MVGTVEKLVGVLERHGAWTLVVLAGFGMVAMARYIVKLHTEHKTEIAALLAERREDTRELTEALVTCAGSLDEMRKMFTALLENKHDQSRAP